jgi:serine/threonine-protein kinase
MPDGYPDVLKHYQLQRELGRGGMGVVFEALDRRDGTRVALKILHPGLALSDPSYRQRFEREAHIAALLRSPYTVQITDFGVEGQVYFLVMEFVEGASVADLIRSGPIEPARAYAIAAEAAHALEEAAARGVVHRDIKPDNILIDSGGRVKVADFGIARSTMAPGMTATGMFTGTVAYAAPEQIEGNADHRSDIYSLGATLYAMLAGRPPFEGTNYLEIIDKHRGAPVPMEPLAGLPDAAMNVVRRCLEKHPLDRYQSASELAGALERARDLLARAAPPSAAPRPAQAAAVSIPAAGAPVPQTIATPAEPQPAQPARPSPFDRPAAVSAPSGPTRVSQAGQPAAAAVEASTPPPLKPGTPADGGDRRRLMIIGGVIAALALVGVMIALGMGGGGDDDGTPAGIADDEPTGTSTRRATPTGTASTAASGGTTAAPGEAGATTATFANKTFYYGSRFEVFEVTVEKGTITKESETSWVVRFDSKAKNLANANRFLSFSAFLTSGSERYQTFVSSSAEIPGNETSNVRWEFRVKPPFSFDDAVITLGNAASNQSIVPLNARQTVTTFKPIEGFGVGQTLSNGVGSQLRIAKSIVFQDYGDGARDSYIMEIQFELTVDRASPDYEQEVPTLTIPGGTSAGAELAYMLTSRDIFIIEQGKSGKPSVRFEFDAGPHGTYRLTWESRSVKLQRPGAVVATAEFEVR